MDAHFHRHDGQETYSEIAGRETRFFGVHPWRAGEAVNDVEGVLEGLRRSLADDSAAGVGEIGLDRLRDRNISEAQRRLFAAQLALAAEFGRPVTLHGAKCWGEVVKACLPYRGRIPAFLFHGFSRSDGLLPDIAALNGFVGVGKALLNDHAVNYRALVKRIPRDRMVVESDLDAEDPDRPRILEAVLARIPDFADVDAASLEGNMAAFLNLK